MYKGGYVAMTKFINKNLRYPKKAVRTATEGTVYVGYVISTTGKVTDVTVERGLSAECDQEAIRVCIHDARLGPRHGEGPAHSCENGVPDQILLRQITVEAHLLKTLSSERSESFLFIPNEVFYTYTICKIFNTSFYGIAIHKASY